MSDSGKDILAVLRCRECGDTFPAGHPSNRCPSCGSVADPAWEPLL